MYGIEEKWNLEYQYIQYAAQPIHIHMEPASEVGMTMTRAAPRFRVSRVSHRP
jgi:hypothetical protein